VQRLVAILRFVRLPLVWTALADVLAAAAVAAAGPAAFARADLLPLLLISPALYLFGMGLNDLLDRHRDAASGADRPLPRGELSPAAAVAVLIVLLGMVAAGASLVREPTLTMVAFTLAAVCLYNGWAKRHTATAVLFMAACRAGNLLIGWSIVAGDWRFWVSPQARYGWALLGAVCALTAAASLVSALEKRHGLTTVAGLRPSRVVLLSLMLLPVADAACVAAAWAASPWAAPWLAAVPLCQATAAALRRARVRTT
jgi:4-hydroxybenzoate polyprenyltransferase